MAYAHTGVRPYKLNLEGRSCSLYTVSSQWVMMRGDIENASKDAGGTCGVRSDNEHKGR